jgi:hypothetical protein
LVTCCCILFLTSSPLLPYCSITSTHSSTLLSTLAVAQTA